VLQDGGERILASPIKILARYNAYVVDEILETDWNARCCDNNGVVLLSEGLTLKQ